jgi:hypothetical protein
LEQLLGLFHDFTNAVMFTAIALLVNLMPLSQPLKLGLLLFHLWMYSEEYQGALLLSALAKKKISTLGL